MVLPASGENHPTNTAVSAVVRPSFKSIEILLTDGKSSSTYFAEYFWRRCIRKEKKKIACNDEEDISSATTSRSKIGKRSSNSSIKLDHTSTSMGKSVVASTSGG